MEYLYSLWETLKPILAFLALLLVPFTILNLYFNLHPRLKDALATRNKKSFLKKFSKKKDRFNRIDLYYKLRESALIIRLLHDFITPLLLFFGSFLLFVIAVWLYITLVPDKPSLLSWVIIYVCGFVAYLFALSSVVELLKFGIFCRDMSYPFIFAESFVTYINQGKKKGYIQSDDNELLNLIINFDLLSDSGKSELKQLAGIETSDQLSKEST
jgi:hypothetical protein